MRKIVFKVARKPNLDKNETMVGSFDQKFDPQEQGCRMYAVDA